MMKRILPAILIFLAFAAKAFPQSADYFENYNYLPGKSIFIGAFASYSNLYFTDNFKFSSPEGFLFDEKNDTYEAEGLGNYRAGIDFTKYLGERHIFAYKISLFYMTRHAELTANSRYLVRDPQTLDTVKLATTSTINTYYASIMGEAALMARLELTRGVYAYTALGFFLGNNIRKNDADFISEINGVIRDGSDIVEPTGITFSNGGQYFEISSDTDEYFSEVIEGQALQAGIRVGFGVEWFLTESIGLRFEASGAGELMRYFKNQSSGMISHAHFTGGIMVGL